MVCVPKGGRGGRTCKIFDEIVLDLIAEILGGNLQLWKPRPLLLLPFERVHTVIVLEWMLLQQKWNTCGTF